MDRENATRAGRCAGAGRTRMGAGETAVIVAFAVLAVALTAMGVPPRDAVLLLGGAGLAAVALVRLVTVGFLPAGTRRWAAETLLPPALDPAVEAMVNPGSRS